VQIKVGTVGIVLSIVEDFFGWSG